MKVAVVTGSRDWTDRETIFRALVDEAPELVLHGACGLDADNPSWEKFCFRLTSVPGERIVLSIAADSELCGADRFADEWAVSVGVPVLRLPARWQSRGRSAGPIRNTRLMRVAEALQDAAHRVVGLGFPLGVARGTRDCLNKLDTASIAYRVFSPKE